MFNRVTALVFFFFEGVMEEVKILCVLLHPTSDR